MLRRFRPTASYWLFVFVLSTMLSAVLVSNPAPARASLADYSWLGRKNYVINYGSKARIDVASPVTNGRASFMFINSYVIDGTKQRFVQTGWSKQPACGTGTYPYIFAEWTEYKADNSVDYHSTCYSSTSGQRWFYQETNSSNYWCNGYESLTCLIGAIPESAVGMSNATYVASYGETSNPVAEMGLKAPNYAYLRQIMYKATRSGQINNPIQSTGENYGSCAVSPCPYAQTYGIESISGTNFLYIGVQTK